MLKENPRVGKHQRQTIETPSMRLNSYHNQPRHSGIRAGLPNLTYHQPAPSTQRAFVHVEDRSFLGNRRTTLQLAVVHSFDRDTGGLERRCPFGQGEPSKVPLKNSMAEITKRSLAGPQKPKGIQTKSHPNPHRTKKEKRRDPIRYLSPNASIPNTKTQYTQSPKSHNTQPNAPDQASPPDQNNTP